LGSHDKHIEKIKKMFLTNSNKQYHFFYNSEKSSRGVGILIDSSLSLSITDNYRDTDQNILGLNVTVNDIELFIVSIYGPNDNDKSFFSNLAYALSLNKGSPIIVGGDWNTTYSTSDSNCNTDILNMQHPPSTIRSGWLNDICISSDLIDLYRAFHPSKRDFTFVPHGSKKKNRSRFDFFLISNPILEFVKSCTIADSVLISLFDHKPVFLNFCQEKVSRKLAINCSILFHPRTDDVVLAAYADTYLAHARGERDATTVRF
jgi:exonuclease III